jgi:hypothetical protein
MEMLAVGSSIISKRCMRLPSGRRDFTGFAVRFQGSGAQWTSLQGVELLEDFGEGGLAFADDLG